MSNITSRHIVGSDAAINMDKWKKPLNILSFSKIVCVPRGGISNKSVKNKLLEIHPQAQIHFLKNVDEKISSTTIKGFIRLGRGFDLSTEISVPHSGYLQYLNDPTTVPQSWKEFFDGLGEDQEVIQKEILGPSWAPKKNNTLKISAVEKDLTEGKETFINDTSVSQENYEKEKEQSVRAIALIRAYRIRGHLIANLDPLGMMERKYLHELHPAAHGFKKEDYNKKIYLHEYMDRRYASINELLSFLRKTYCSTIGVEYMHISDPAEKIWFRERMEKKENQLNFTDAGKKLILNKLIQAEGFENFLAVKFVGTKRFGIDGGESLIPALEQIIKRGGQLGVKEVKIGMPHRGRLNVLANLLQKSYKRIFNEFAGEFGSSIVESAGDVKYHLGASSNREFDGNSVHISLTDNPSHLEAVNPVVVGKVRAKQDQKEDLGRRKVAALLIHGDAAFSGQGLVPETLDLSELKGSCFDHCNSPYVSSFITNILMLSSFSELITKET